MKSFILVSMLMLSFSTFATENQAIPDCDQCADKKAASNDDRKTRAPVVNEKESKPSAVVKPKPDGSSVE